MFAPVCANPFAPGASRCLSPDIINGGLFSNSPPFAHSCTRLGGFAHQQLALIVQQVIQHTLGLLTQRAKFFRFIFIFVLIFWKSSRFSRLISRWAPSKPLGLRWLVWYIIRTKDVHFLLDVGHVKGVVFIRWRRFLPSLVWRWLGSLRIAWIALVRCK